MILGTGDIRDKLHQVIYNQDLRAKWPTELLDTTTISTNSKPATESPNNSQLITDETYDDSQFEPAFNERTCRRNLKISRSGRFKEKRRIRATLPENNNFYEGKDAAAAQEGLR
ncbi:hypothetical protein AGOR_G00211310 [Albula goreensis]|uniref:Uncharacterized protein n=1 Tax=Albula goreensis TaxID=1534307 RepID=A0A8T3CQX8_9TELE|nr:hypothetical protein AGOR_G00211310 [Albula goreensis]